MLYKTGFVSISPTVAKWQATQNCVTDRHEIFPLTAIAPILNGGWGQKEYSITRDKIMFPQFVNGIHVYASVFVFS